MTIPQATTTTERVAAGAAFLDEHDPGWWRADADRAISLGTLDLGEPECCILGQRCPVDVLTQFAGTEDGDIEFYAYTAYATKLTGLDEVKNKTALARWGDAHGFSDWGCNGHHYPVLTRAWHDLITARRKEAADAGDAR